MRERLAEVGIQTSVHYQPVHLFQLYRDQFAYSPGDLPVTESAAAKLISLPFYPTMTVKEVDVVVEAVKGSL